MLRTALRVSGVARALGDMKLRLEEKAEDATAQVKGIAVRIAVAAGLALAAMIFLVLALIAGLIALYAYLQQVYGVVPALATVGGLMLAVALVCGIAAMLIARRRSKRKASRTETASDRRESRGDDEWAYDGHRPMRRRAYATPEERAAAEVTDSIVSLASSAGRVRGRRFNGRGSRGNGRAHGHDTETDAAQLVQSADRGTMMAVLGAVAAVGWLLGRTMPQSNRQ